MTAKELIQQREIQRLNKKINQQDIEIVELKKEITAFRKALLPFVLFAKSDTGKKPASAASAYPVPGLLYADFLQAKNVLRKNKDS